MPGIWNAIKDFLGLSATGPVGYIVGLLFYIALAIFIIFWAIEIPIKLTRKLFRKPHEEHRIKRVSRIAFKTTLFGKFAFFCLLLFIAAVQADVTESFLNKYIRKPDNLVELVKVEKVFLIIFFLVLMYGLSFRRRKKAVEK